MAYFPRVEEVPEDYEEEEFDDGESYGSGAIAPFVPQSAYGNAPPSVGRGSFNAGTLALPGGRGSFGQPQLPPPSQVGQLALPGVTAGRGTGLPPAAGRGGGGGLPQRLALPPAPSSPTLGQYNQPAGLPALPAPSVPAESYDNRALAPYSQAPSFGSQSRQLALPGVTSATYEQQQPSLGTTGGKPSFLPNEPSGPLALPRRPPQYSAEGQEPVSYPAITTTGQTGAGQNVGQKRGGRSPPTSGTGLTKRPATGGGGDLSFQQQVLLAGQQMSEQVNRQAQNLGQITQRLSALEQQRQEQQAQQALAPPPPPPLGGGTLARTGNAGNLAGAGYRSLVAYLFDFAASPHPPADIVQRFTTDLQLFHRRRTYDGGFSSEEAADLLTDAAQVRSPVFFQLLLTAGLPDRTGVRNFAEQINANPNWSNEAKELLRSALLFFA